MLRRTCPPTVVITQLSSIDNWKRIIVRFLTNKITVEDRLRFLYKIRFYDYNAISENRLKNIIDKYHIEIGFITTFSNILSTGLLALFPRGVYNFHPSLLPEHGGANPIFWVVLNNDEITGTTCHIATRKVDSGDILLQTKYRVKGMDSLELFRKYERDVSVMIPSILNNFSELKRDIKKMGKTIYDPDIDTAKLNREYISKQDRARLKKATKIIGV